MNSLALGQLVRLSVEAARKVHLRLDQKDHPSATIIDRWEWIGPGYVRLSCELMGSDVWHERHLRKIKMSTEPKHSEILLRFKQSLLPTSKRHIQMDKDTHSNIDFGFSPAQALVLDRFEDSTRGLASAEGVHIRDRRKLVLSAYAEVQKAGLTAALTPLELQTVNGCFGNTVLA